MEAVADLSSSVRLNLCCSAHFVGFDKSLQMDADYVGVFDGGAGNHADDFRCY